MPVIEHFDLIAPLYNRMMRPADPQRFKQLLSLPVTGRLLDAGGGSGRVALALAPFAGWVVVADLSLPMLRQMTDDAIERACAAGEHLPFADGCFERVVMVDAFHHVIDQPRSAAELWRVLKPGGRLVIEEPDLRLFRVKLLALAEKLMLMRSHIITPQAIAALFTDANASVSIQSEAMSAWVIVEKHAA